MINGEGYVNIAKSRANNEMLDKQSVIARIPGPQEDASTRTNCRLIANKNHHRDRFAYLTKPA